MKAKIENNTTILKTPLTDFYIIDDCDKRIEFDVIPSINKIHTVYSEKAVNQCVEVENYAECIIRIDTKKLDIGRKYKVISTSKLEYRDSDEHLFTAGITKGQIMLAISFPAPNDLVKCGIYDSEMKWFDFNFKDDGVEFELIDRERLEILIPVAWIWNVKDNFENYESSVELFTWVI